MQKETHFRMSAFIKATMYYESDIEYML